MWCLYADLIRFILLLNVYKMPTGALLVILVLEVMGIW